MADVHAGAGQSAYVIVEIADARLTPRRWFAGAQIVIDVKDED